MNLTDRVQSAFKDADNYIQQLETSQTSLASDLATATQSLAEAQQAKQNAIDACQAAEQKMQSMSVELGQPKGKVTQRIGFNIGALSSPAYADIDKVIDTLLSINIKFIRVSFDYNPATGKMLEHDKWTNKVKPKLDAAGIHTRAMFYLRGTDGYSVFTKIKTLYPYFDEIEVGNENALRSLTTGSGLLPEEYDMAKLKKDCIYINDAVRALLQWPVDSIVSATWIHYYYIDYLRSLGCNPKISIHSYSDGFNNVKNQPAFLGMDALQAARSKYGKAVFEIGEAGYMPSKTIPYTDAEQLKVGEPFVRQIFANNIDTYFYELIDRPERPGREAHFGFFDDKFNPKPLMLAVKDLFDNIQA
ncbi:hypothetical protein A0256_23175 [Mucilaginibacter sp. PAMC 26640]|nr:hypothetical protein A0256_23175 [Mucilaginibacter sp. PAMC 26640]